ncbi:AbiH family protein [Latilactobacillus sakei]
MNITFLLGNGFDIQCGLKTGYSDFYQYILNKKYSVNLSEKYSEQVQSTINNLIYAEIYKDKNIPETWADLELQLGQYTSKLKSELTADNNAEKVIEKFFEDYEELVEDLNNYLDFIQIPSDNSIEDCSDILFTTLDKFFEGLLGKEHLEVLNKLKNNINNEFRYNFISFNYTNTLQKILDSCSDRSKKNNFNGYNNLQTVDMDIVNIHGKIDSFLTLGVNDSSQVASDFFNDDDLSDLIKPKSLELDRGFSKQNAELEISRSDIIVIFGLSLGSTDKYWWEQVARSLIANGNRKLIIHIHEPTSSNVVARKVRIRRKSKENMFISHLEALGLSDEDIVQLRKQIYIITNSEYIFNVDLSKYLPQRVNIDNIVDFDVKNDELVDTAN